MRILAVFDKFKDSFSAQKACMFAENAAKDISSNIDLVGCPLTDGGEGFVDILTPKYTGDFLDVDARDSFGNMTKAKIGFVQLCSLPSNVCSFLNLPNRGKLAIIEMASVCGLSDIAPNQRNPWVTSTLGVGDLLLAAKNNDAEFILLGIGGSSTNDAGIGALSALGLSLKDAKDQEIEHPSPENWDKVSHLDTSTLESIPPVIIACDVNNPLLGQDGATYQFGGQKGLNEADFPVLEKGMAGMVEQLEKAFPDASIRAVDQGTGAAGGIGYGLSLACKVSLVSGFDLVSCWLDLGNEIAKADFVITGEGRFDSTSWRGKGPFEILSLAQNYHKKVFLVCGSIEQSISGKVDKEFPGNRLISIANDSWPLSKNLELGPSLFSDSCRDIFCDLLKIKSDDSECPVIKEARFKRIRRLKKFLRPLPRRSNIHRYPILKWFADTAYKKSFLWSFKGSPVQSALFWGIWISMLPIVGIQMIVVFFVSLVVRANLPLIVALQWISNPFTMGPIYFADYKIGMILLKLIGVDYPKNRLLSPNFDWADFSYKELIRLLDTFPPMFLGGSVLGIFLGVLSVFLYKIFSKFYKN